MSAEAVATRLAVTDGADVQIPTVFACGLRILALKMALKSRGFAWTIRQIRRRVEAIPTTAAVSVEVVKAAEHAVAMAGALYPGRALCLEQSLTLYYLLRRQGVGVKYRQGIRPHPFEAHAWVEYQGEVISDVAEHAQLFARLPDQLP